MIILRTVFHPSRIILLKAFINLQSFLAYLHIRPLSPGCCPIELPDIEIFQLFYESDYFRRRRQIMGDWKEKKNKADKAIIIRNPENGQIHTYKSTDQVL
jgi:hypothetical protein